MALAPGRTIGRYEILAVLGQGGFGITYRARDTQLNREVALKEYLPVALAVRQDGASVLPRSTEVAEDFDWGRERFIEEGRTLATLHEAPAIVQVFDFLEENGTAYIVMELLRGETLEERIKAEDAALGRELDAILWPLIEGLQQGARGGLPASRHQARQRAARRRATSPTLIDFGASRAAMADRTADHDGDLHARLCRARAVRLGQAGTVDRHLRARPPRSIMPSPARRRPAPSIG